MIRQPTLALGFVLTTALVAPTLAGEDARPSEPRPGQMTMFSTSARMAVLCSMGFPRCGGSWPWYATCAGAPSGPVVG